MRLIDADALMEWLYAENKKKWWFSTDEVMDVLRKAPTIDPVQQGKWKVSALGSMTCTNCGWSYDYWEGMEYKWHYCPHCGARKDGPVCDW